MGLRSEREIKSEDGILLIMNESKANRTKSFYDRSIMQSLTLDTRLDKKREIKWSSQESKGLKGHFVVSYVIDCVPKRERYKI